MNLMSLSFIVKIFPININFCIWIKEFMRVCLNIYGSHESAYWTKQQYQLATKPGCINLANSLAYSMYVSKKELSIPKDSYMILQDVYPVQSTRVLRRVKHSKE